METVEVRLWDDLAEPKTVEATERITIALNGEVSQLDLSPENYKIVTDQMRSWMSCGRTPAGRRSHSQVPGAPPGSRRYASVEYNRQLREYARERGEPAHGSSDYVSVAIRKDFAALHGAPPVWRKVS